MSQCTLSSTIVNKIKYKYLKTEEFKEPDMVLYACNTSTQKAETERSRVQG
jgi:hypothetical protein